MGNTVRINWHQGFYGGIELELRDYRGILDFDTEHELSKQPIRMDMLIVKKTRDVEIVNPVARIFRKHNIIEYKSPDDGLSIDELYKVIGYAGLYKGLGRTVDEIRADELTISFFRHKYPRRLFSSIKSLGAVVRKEMAGIYHIEGIINFPIQIVVIGELAGSEHAPLRILTKGAEEEDIKAFLGSAVEYKEPGDRTNADAILEVSVRANLDMFRKVQQEEEAMSDALRELMKDDIFTAREEGRTEGRTEGALDVLYSLVHDGLLSIKDAAKRAGMTEQSFAGNMKKVYG